MSSNASTASSSVAASGINLSSSSSSTAAATTTDSSSCTIRTMRDHDKLTFGFRGGVRPGLISGRRAVPEGIPRPDYALHPNGESIAEQRAYKLNRAERQTGDRLVAVRRAAAVARQILDIAIEAVRPGISTDAIDAIVHDATIARNAYPSTLGYFKFPKSCCTSINEVICHGIPDSTVLQEGDIVNLDISAYIDGCHGDCNETVFVGKPVLRKNNNNNNKPPTKRVDEAAPAAADVQTTTQTEEAGAPAEEELLDMESIQLVHTTYHAMMTAIGICKPGTMYKHIGDAVESVTDRHHYGVVRSVCGHGIADNFHCPPNVAHYRGNKNIGAMANGHVFTVEPMINLGTWKDVTWPDNWTMTTADGRRSAQFEHMVLVTKEGSEVLTLSDKFGGRPFYQLQLEQWGIALPEP